MAFNLNKINIREFIVHKGLIPMVSYCVGNSKKTSNKKYQEILEVLTLLAHKNLSQAIKNKAYPKWDINRPFTFS